MGSQRSQAGLVTFTFTWVMSQAFYSNSVLLCILSRVVFEEILASAKDQDKLWTETSYLWDLLCVHLRPVHFTVYKLYFEFKRSWEEERENDSSSCMNNRCHLLKYRIRNFPQSHRTDWVGEAASGTASQGAYSQKPSTWGLTFCFLGDSPNVSVSFGISHLTFLLVIERT